MFVKFYFTYESNHHQGLVLVVICAINPPDWPFHHEEAINSSPPSAAYMRQLTG